MEPGFKHRQGGVPILGKRVEIVPDAGAFLEALLVGEVGAPRQGGLLALELPLPKQQDIALRQFDRRGFEIDRARLLDLHAADHPLRLCVESLEALGQRLGQIDHQQLDELAADGIEVSVEADTLSAPARLGNFRVRVTIPGLPEGKRAKAKAFVESCLVGQTLKVANSIDLELG